jgi:hypothetical protein
MKATVVIIEGYWKDDRRKFEHRCLVMPKDASDSMRDEIIKDVGDDSIFYVFEEGEQILGEHRDFVVVFYHPVRSIELGAVQ